MVSQEAPKDLQADLEKALGEARRFAGNEYTVALMKGDKLTTPERTNVVREMARLTGLSEHYIERVQFACLGSAVHKELLRDQRKTLGRYDSRLEGEDIDAVGEGPNTIPAMRPCKASSRRCLTITSARI